MTQGDGLTLHVISAMAHLWIGWGCQGTNAVHSTVSRVWLQLAVIWLGMCVTILLPDVFRQRHQR